MKRAILFSCLCFCLLFSHAQSSIAIVGGLHGSTITPDFITRPDTSKNMTAANSVRGLIGIEATIPITKKLFFQTGVLYTVKGSDNTQFYDTTNLYARTASLPPAKKQMLLSAKTVLTVNYMEIPLNLLFKFPIKGHTKFIIGGGPQLSVMYSGTAKTDNWYVSQADLDSAARWSYKGFENNDLPVGKAVNRYRILHFGVKAFGGMEFGRVFLTVNYTNDLNEFYEEEGRLYKAKTIGANLGIYLGKRNSSAAKNQ